MRTYVLLTTCRSIASRNCLRPTDAAEHVRDRFRGVVSAGSTWLAPRRNGWQGASAGYRNRGRPTPPDSAALYVNVPPRSRMPSRWEIESGSGHLQVTSRTPAVWPGEVFARTVTTATPLGYGNVLLTRSPGHAVDSPSPFGVRHCCTRVLGARSPRRGAADVRPPRRAAKGVLFICAYTRAGSSRSTISAASRPILRGSPEARSRVLALPRLLDESLRAAMMTSLFPLHRFQSSQLRPAHSAHARGAFRKEDGRPWPDLIVFRASSPACTGIEISTRGPRSTAPARFV